jgi:hypothetical protein
MVSSAEMAIAAGGDWLAGSATKVQVSIGIQTGLSAVSGAPGRD